MKSNITSTSFDFFSSDLAPNIANKLPIKNVTMKKESEVKTQTVSGGTNTITTVHYLLSITQKNGQVLNLRTVPDITTIFQAQQ